MVIQATNHVVWRMKMAAMAMAHAMQNACSPGKICKAMGDMNSYCKLRKEKTKGFEESRHNVS